MKTTLAILAGAWLVAATLVAGAAERPGEEQKKAQGVDRNSGAYLYRVFCVSCHGETGKGEGPVAAVLRTPPGDLTQIARRAGGVFPRDTVIRQIDGRLPVLAHGRQDMPIWGEALKASEGQDERIVRQRIEAIASHIESIQVR